MGGFCPAFHQLYVLIWHEGVKGLLPGVKGGGGHLAHVWLVIHDDAIFTSLLKQREDLLLSGIAQTPWLKGARRSANSMLTVVFLLLTAKRRASHPKSGLIQM